ncbi:MAG: glycosyltransferase family 1 protein [Deltaproteobacteria bacterium]|nr:glycosyltransferase family 1 protein [Deltaproteobacteria bacterium]
MACPGLAGARAPNSCGIKSSGISGAVLIMIIGVDARPLSTLQLTGIGVYLNNLLQALQEMDRENHYYLISNTAIHFEVVNPRWKKIEGRWPQKMISTLWMQCCIPRIAARGKLDLFWGPRHQLPLFISKKIKMVLTIHDIVHVLFPRTMRLPTLITERLLMRHSILRADYVIADSLSTASGIQEHYKAQVTQIGVIYPGAPACLEQVPSPGSAHEMLPRKYFLFVGTLEPRKNLRAILQAFALLDAQREDVDLVIVGNIGWKTKDAINLLETHRHRRRIHLAGYVDDARLSFIYQKAFCLLYPSLYEGFGFPILEAMNHGVPVITSNVSSMPEVAGDAALLVDPRDEEGLAEAMKKILASGEIRKILISKGYERVKKFSWKRCARETLDTFGKVGSRKGSVD